MSSASLQQGRLCTLAIGTVENEVALGVVFDGNNPNSTVHGASLSPPYVHVAINVALKEYARLPFPINDDKIFVHQAVGFKVAWPKPLVIMTAIGESSRIPESAEEYTPPSFIKALIKYVDRHMDENGAIELQMEAGIIDDVGGCFYLKKNDIISFCTAEEVKITIMLTFIRLFYEKLKKCHMDDLFGFVDPSTLSEGSGYSLQYKANELVSRMLVVKPQQLLLYPYNVENRWTLVVMNPNNCVIHFLDPLGQETSPDLKKLLLLASKMFIGKKEDRRGLTWRKIKFHGQTSHAKSGYHVMKYMEEIATDPNISIAYKFNGRNSYTQMELEEVRSDLAKAIRNFFAMKK